MKSIKPKQAEGGKKRVRRRLKSFAQTFSLTSLSNTYGKFSHAFSCLPLRGALEEQEEKFLIDFFSRRLADVALKVAN